MIEIRPAATNDIPQLISLNSKWQYEGNNQNQKLAGFLLNAVFSEVDFQRIIDAEEIVIAEDSGKVVGYYLVDNYSDTDNLKHNIALITKLKELDLLKSTLRIGPRAQAVIDINFHNQGVARKMFDELKVYLIGKFDVLFTVVSKLNPKIIAHQKMGWEVIYQDNDWYYVLYNL